MDVARETTRSARDGLARRTGRGAAAYVFFLGTTTLVMVIALSAMTVMRIESRGTDDNTDAMAARFYARSAIELGLLKIRDDPDWRTNLGNGTWIDEQAIGAGTMTLEVTILSNMDGNANNDPVTFTAIGRQGNACHKMSVQLEPLSDLGGLIFLPGSWKQAAL